MKALDLIEESNEILQLADGHPGVRLVGQSKEESSAHGVGQLRVR